MDAPCHMTGKYLTDSYVHDPLPVVKHAFLICLYWSLLFLSIKSLDIQTFSKANHTGVKIVQKHALLDISDRRSARQRS